jgi:nucleotide-binding universal stress UspA family protein
MTSFGDYDRAPTFRVLHTTDFSQASNVAFAHALRVALAASAELNILHVARPGGEPGWAEFPGIRRTLQRWGGALPETTSRQAALETGLRVGKILGADTNPVRSVLDYLTMHPTELIVLATHQRTGIGRLFHQATAGPIARGSGAMTLFLPEGVEGFVARESGAVALREILVPVDRAPAPQAAVDTVSALLDGLGCPEARVTLLHVGEDRAMPPVRTAAGPDRCWDRVARRGDPVDEIIRAADERAAALIVMTTEGRHGFLDALRGSTTERVLQRAACPVLAVPVGSRAMSRLFLNARWAHRAEAIAGSRAGRY